MLIILNFAIWSRVFLIWIKHLVNKILIFIYLKVQEQFNDKNHMNGLYQFVDRIDTIMYTDYRINIKSINDPNIFNLGCEMRDTCNEIHEKN